MAEEKKSEYLLTGKQVAIGVGALVALVFGGGQISNMGYNMGREAGKYECRKKIQDVREQLKDSNCKELLKGNVVEYRPMSEEVDPLSCICMQPTEEGRVRVTYTPNHGKYHR
jgi:hypothetical protein